MCASSPESSQELHYPPVQVNRSLASLDLNTLIMRSNPRRLVDEPNSSLDDSTYEVLGDSIYSVSDDEGHTESLASTDVATPDDVAAFSDEETFDEDYANDASQHFPRYTETTEESLDAPHMAGPDESTLTETAHMDESESSRLVRLEEVSSGEDDVASAWGLVKGFDNKNGLPAVLQGYGHPDIRLIVRAALSQQYMPVTGSFRILYVGSYPDWAEKEISSHIGKALDAPPGSSRYIQVGGQMEQYGPVLDIDHCTALEVREEDGKQNQVLVALDDGTQFALGPRRAFKTRGATPFPDLVIFCHPSPFGSSKEIEKLSLARDAFRRSHIPSLDIALTRPFGSYLKAASSDTGSLQLCVEGRGDAKSDYELQEVLPIDHYELVHMDPSQLNRHLAFIKARCADSSSPRRRGWARQLFKKGFGYTMSGSRPTLLHLSLWSLLTMVLVSLLMTTYAPGFTLKPEYADVKEPISAFSSLNIVSPSPMTTPSGQLPIGSPLPPRLITQTGLSLVLPPWENRHGRKKEEKLAAFEIQATSDHQFVLSPSKNLAGGKRKPQLQIQVFRDAKAVPVRYVRTLSGVYIVDLEQEYPAGNFNVSIATHSKPHFQQAFQIQLGRNRSKIAQLIQTLRHDVTQAQLNFKNISLAVSRSLHEGLFRLETGTAACKSSISGMSGQMKKAKEELDHQLKVGSIYLERLRGSTWQQLRTTTAPVRTSPQVLWLRKQALQARRKLDKNSGFLKEKPVEEKKANSGRKRGGMMAGFGL